MEYNEQHKLMNKNRSRDIEISIILSNLKGKVVEGGGKGGRSTKGLVCVYMGLAGGHGQLGGGGICGEGFGMGMGG